MLFFKVGYYFYLLGFVSVPEVIVRDFVTLNSKILSVD
jgi:hypothetical protein